MSDLRLPDLNRVIIAGRLTNDPDLKYISSGKAVCKLRLASSRQYKTRDGEKREDTTFVDVTVWDRQAEFCGENLQKGRPVLVEGSLKTDSWEDKDTGQKRSKIEINAQRVQVMDWDDRGGGGGSSKPAAQRSGGNDREEEAPEDDIPF